MIDFTLTEEQQALQQLAREFTEQEIKPIVKERERIADPSERFPWQIVDRWSELGLRTLAAPKEHGGGGADALTLCIINEELAVGDLAIATVFDQTNRLTQMLFRLSNPDQIQRHLKPLLANPRGLVAIGLTEPNVGSENVLPFDEPGEARQMLAVRRDGGYVLNGLKQFISQGSDASLYIIMARTHPTNRFTEAASGFVVSRDTSGFTIGRIWDKIGQRLINNADLVFENCWIPEEDRLVGEHEFYPAVRRFMRGGNPEAGALCLGPGRAAYEAAVSWAQQRVQGGKPIIEHQAIQMMLADMAIKLETARLVVWKAAWAADNLEPFDFRLPGISKIYASEVAFDVCRLAMEIHGGYGIMKDLMLEKYLRDASTMLHSDGTNQIHRLRIANFINRGMVGTA